MYERGHIFVPIQQSHLPEDVIGLLSAARAFLLPVSFLSLGQFGCLLFFPEGLLRQGTRVAFALLFFAYTPYARPVTVAEEVRDPAWTLPWAVPTWPTSRCSGSSAVEMGADAR